MAPTVADIIGIMETLAPNRLAESWDNVGLQVGDPGWPVETIRVALDPLPETLAAAVEAGAGMLIAHHPLLFRSVGSVDVSTPVGKAIETALKGRLAVFCAHTNLDSVAGGVNDILARRIGLDPSGVLSGEKADEVFKLVVFVPEEHEPALREALTSAGAGRIGAYTACTFRSGGLATFLPGPGSRPWTGRSGRLSQVEEVRLEMRVAKELLADVLTALKGVHPYETAAYDLYPLLGEGSGQGLGRVGTLDPARTLDDFAESVRRALGLCAVRVVGDGAMTVRRAAVCSGSGGSLLEAVFAARADVYVTGDLRYHDARDAQARGVGLIDIGHFAGESIVVEPLVEKLASAVAEAGWSVDVGRSDTENDPFRIL